MFSTGLSSFIVLCIWYHEKIVTEAVALVSLPTNPKLMKASCATGRWLSPKAGAEEDLSSALLCLLSTMGEQGSSLLTHSPKMVRIGEGKANTSMRDALTKQEWAPPTENKGDAMPSFTGTSWLPAMMKEHEHRPFHILTSVTCHLLWLLWPGVDKLSSGEELTFTLVTHYWSTRAWQVWLGLGSTAWSEGSFWVVKTVIS